MKVSELRKHLEALPDDAPVVLAQSGALVEIKSVSSVRTELAIHKVRIEGESWECDVNGTPPVQVLLG